MQKILEKTTEFSFIGYQIIAKAIESDFQIDSLSKMSPSVDVTVVKHFCGMVKYIAKVCPDRIQ